jgi:hypothetical protein
MMVRFFKLSRHPTRLRVGRSRSEPIQAIVWRSAHLTGGVECSFWYDRPQLHACRILVDAYLRQLIDPMSERPSETCPSRGGQSRRTARIEDG